MLAVPLWRRSGGSALVGPGPATVPSSQAPDPLSLAGAPLACFPADQEIGLQAAGDLLAERFGQQFKVFWAVGLLAAGQVSTIALT